VTVPWLRQHIPGGDHAAATGLFSTITRCPKLFPSLSAMKRAGISVGPPAAKPTTRRIGLAG